MAELPEHAGEILAFWFGERRSDNTVGKEHQQLWFAKDSAIDREIRERFGALLRPALEGELNWQGTPRGRLALILLLDQFSRNIFRGTAEAFAYDPAALTLCLAGLALGDDRQCGLFERTFFYLPLEHAEDLGHQELSVTLFRSLLQEAREPLQQMFTSFHDYAVRHRDIIARFGRFPHRNTILGRVSTSDELAFLLQPGSSF
jgi:uncharacterized protein (DUF924 family)